MGNSEKKYSIGQAAKYVGVSKDTLRRWEKKGRITPFRSPTNRRYYHQEQLDNLLKKPKTGQKKPAKKSSTLNRESLKLTIYSLLSLSAAVLIALALIIFIL